MGIQGLTTFIDASPHLLVSHNLCNTHVVIDGNNLLHCLYHDSGVEQLFGGDYDRFYRRAKSYFAVYKKCKITPYLVFDGGYEASDRKFKTTLKRYGDRLDNVRFQSRGRNLKNRLLPILAMDVFQDVLTDLKIPHAQCDYEADAEIAALANLFSCPVLSLDSDFYIFDVAGGFVPLNTVDTVVKQKMVGDVASYYLECQIYHVDNFLRKFKGIDRSVLPLFATVLGNDFVDVRTFGNFYQKAKFSKSRRLKISFRQQTMFGLLMWLKSKPIAAAIEEILDCLKEDQRPHAKTLIESSVKNYTQCSPTLIQALGIDNVETKPYQLKTKYGKELPDDFSKAFCEMKLPPFLLNAVGLHRVLLLPQIEHIPFPSSYQVSKRIRKFIYGILFTNEEPADNSGKRAATVCEYDRFKRNIVKKHILPERAEFTALNKLCDLSKSEAKKLFSEVLEVGSDFPSSWPECIHLPLMIVKYWVNRAKPTLTENQLNSLLVSILRLMFLKSTSDSKDQTNINLGSDSEGESEDNLAECVDKLASLKVEEKETSLATNFTNSEIVFCQSRLKKFFCKLDIHAKRSIDSSMLHGFAQFQTCVLYTSICNRLLDFPFPHVRPARIFNGTFLYSFCKELERRPYPDLYIAEMLGRGSHVDKFYCSIKKHILEEAPFKLIATVNVPVKKNKQKNKDHKQKNKNDSNKLKANSDACKYDEGKSKSNPKERTVLQARVELNNKFQSLENYDSESSVEYEVISLSSDSE